MMSKKPHLRNLDIDVTDSTNIDDSNTLASAKAVSILNDNLTQLEQTVNEHSADNVRHVDYAVANGTNTYTASVAGISQLIEGMSLKVKFTNTNSGASTLNINNLGAKSIKKSNGNDLSSGNIKAGQVLHLVYTGSNFQLLGEGGEYGNVTSNKVLEGTTFGTENGIQTGTMPNRGSIGTIRPGTTNKNYGSGFYNNFTVEGSANLIPANIKQGVSIFGVTGTLTPEGMGGVKYASGTKNHDGINSSFQRVFGGGGSYSFKTVTVSGLNFTPRIIILRYSSFHTIYNGEYNSAFVIMGSSSDSVYYLSPNGYVNETGFKLPVPYESSGVYSWLAYS